MRGKTDGFTIPTHLPFRFPVPSRVSAALGKGVSPCITLNMHCFLSLVLRFCSLVSPDPLGEGVGMVMIQLPLCAECCASTLGFTVHFILATSGKK